MNKNNKWIYILLFTIPAIYILFSKMLDNDLWYILAEGRYIVQNGLYKVDVLSIHRGLDIVVQNWGASAIFWLIFDYFGEIGIITLVLVCNFAICTLLYKICMIISDNKKWLSLIIMLISDLFLASFYLVTRPQIISYVLLLYLIYILEVYIHKHNKKILWIIPVISLIQINLHSSLWLMLFLFIIPYLLDGIKWKKFNFEGYNILPILWPTLVAVPTGLLNPYGYKAITFIFGSFMDKSMHLVVKELSSFSFSYSIGKCVFAVIVAIIVAISLYKKGNLKIRYLCLILGTMLLGFISIKGFSHFFLVSFFPFACYFKDMTIKKISIKKWLVALYKYGIATLAIASIIVVFGLYAKNSKNISLANGTSEALHTLSLLANPKTSKVYASFNNGGCVEYAGFKSYIDPRAEVYLKRNNHKEDILKEFYDLQTGQLNLLNFIQKYNFTHILTDATDILFNVIPDNYIVIYESADYGMRLLARKDLFTREQIEEIERQYQLSKK